MARSGSQILTLHGGRRTGRSRWLRHTLLAGAAIGAQALAQRAEAQTQTWKGGTPIATPPSVSGKFDWSNAANWQSGTVPNSATATAVFPTTTSTDLAFSTNTIVDGIQFQAGAPAYTFTLPSAPLFLTPPSGITVTLGGQGIVNSSAFAPTFNIQSDVGAGVSNAMVFANHADAANAIFNLSGPQGSIPRLTFQDFATADTATINAPIGQVAFNNSADAGTATFNMSGTVNGVVVGGGTATFNDTSNLHNATFNLTRSGALIVNSSTALGAAHINVTGSTANAGATEIAFLQFNNSANAGSATIVLNGGSNGSVALGQFTGSSSAGSAQITLNAGADHQAAESHLEFDGNATAGTSTITNNGGEIDFGLNGGTPSAGAATITTNGIAGLPSFSVVSGPPFGIAVGPGAVVFRGASDAGTSHINIGTAGVAIFTGTSDARTATFDISGTAADKGTLIFKTNANANGATIDTHAHGQVLFFDTASGGHATFNTDAGGTVDFTNLTSGSPVHVGGGGTTVGAINGAGSYILGNNILTIGGTNLDSNVSGTISGTGGIVKQGIGTLTLAGTNSYTGGTTISNGTVQIGDATHTGKIVGNVDISGVFSNLTFFDADNSGLGTITAGPTGTIDFLNSTIAGPAVYNLAGAVLGCGCIEAPSINFHDNSVAGTATINLDHSASASFDSAASAGSATINLNGSLDNSGSQEAGFVTFSGISTAGNSQINVNAGANGNLALLIFAENATAGNATININLNGQSNTDPFTGFPTAAALFADGSDAGTATINNKGVVFFGLSQFTPFDSASANQAIINTSGIAGETPFTITAPDPVFPGDVFSTSPASDAGVTFFTGDSTLANATLNTSDGGLLLLTGSALGGSASVNTNAGGFVVASGDFDAQNASFTTQSGGTVLFTNFALGGSAAFDTKAGGILDFSMLLSGGTTASAITGDGDIYLGANNLEIGGTNADSTFGGVIQDGRSSFAIDNPVAGETGGSLTKTGIGTLTLTGANTYTGGTTVSDGTLDIGDATHTGKIIGDIDLNGASTINFINADTSGLDTVTASSFGTIDFQNATSAGTAVYNLTGSESGGSIIAPFINFENNSTAGSATINLDEFSSAQFNDATTAGASTINLNGSMAGPTGNNGGSILFFGTSTAGSSNINVKGGSNGNLAELFFSDSSSAGSAHISIDRNGQSSIDTSSGVALTSAIFADNSKAGTATIDNDAVVFFGTAFDTASDAATADHATINTTGDIASAPFSLAFDPASHQFLGTFSATIGETIFAGTSTLDHATLNQSANGVLRLIGSSSGGNATIATDAGGFVLAGGSFDAQNATFTTKNGGAVLFTNGASGGSATFDTQAGGILDLSMLTNGGAPTSTTAGSITGGGNIFLGANTLIVGGTNASATFGGVIQDGASAFAANNPGGETGGKLVKTGTGTLILTGNNIYTGGTTISGGTIQVGNGGTSGALGSGDVADSGALAFDRSDTITFGGAISGTGSLSQIGTGTTILTGNNGYTGGTTISAGILQIGNGGTSGSLGTGPVVDNAALAFDRSDSLIVAGAISGTGSLSQIGTGRTILTGTNSYSGGTTISAGTLQIGNGGAAGSITGNVTDNGNLAFDRSDTITFGGIVSGSGSLSQIGAGTTILTGANGHTGGTTISAGTLQLGNGGTGGSITGNVTDNANLAFDHSDNVIFGGAISGSGSLSQIGTGNLILTGTNSFAGPLGIVAGTVQIGNGGTTGSIGAISVIDATQIIFDRSDDIGFGGSISGAGGLTKDGAGILTLTGANSYTGATTINAGTILLSGAGSIASTALNLGAAGATFDISAGASTKTIGDLSGVLGTHVILGANNLILGTNNSTIFSGTFAGTGNLKKQGNGILTLKGDSSATFSGTVVISGLGGIDAEASGALGTGLVQIKNALGIDPLLIVGDGVTLANPIVLSAPLTAEQDGGTGTLAGAISENVAGQSLTKTGSGTLILAGIDTYTGGTTISGGTLQIGNGNSTGRIVGDVVDNGVLAFNSPVNVTFGGVISGSGALNQIGSGTLILTGNNSYAGGSTISSGALQIGNGGTTGSIVGNVTDNGDLIFDRSDNISFGGVVSGSGNLTKAGAGTLTLTAAENYTGFTLITNGTLALGAGSSIASSRGVDLFSNAIFDISGGGNQTIADLTGFSSADAVHLGTNTLTVGTANSTIFDGVISGSGGLTKVGSGTLALIGVNTYTGDTTISAGTLEIGDGGGTGSIAGNVVDNANLAFSQLGVLTYAGNISGTGTVTQLGAISGASTVILTGANSYSGGTLIANGTIQVGNGGTSGTLGNGSVIDNGALAFDRSDTVVFGGNISGTGQLNQIGTGTTILTGDNSYTGTARLVGVNPSAGATTISAGTLQIGNGGTAGSIIGNVVDNANLAFDRSDTITFGGLISGTGSLSQIGAGTTILTGNDTYSGGTTISAGTLQVGNGGTNGTLGTGNVTDNGILIFDRSNTILFGGAINGSGALKQIGTGTLTLTGNSSYSGGTTISAGRLNIGIGGTAGSILGDVADNGVLAFNRSDSVTFGGVISGTGALSQIGAGTLILTGANSYFGATTIANGTIQVGNGGTGGTLGTGNVSDFGTLAFDRSDSVTFGGVIFATGSLRQIGTGTTILTGNNVYTGGTSISAGTLQLGNGGTSGSIIGNVADNGILAFDRSDSVTFGGLISGTGSLSQIGTGVLTVTGANSYSGGTTVSAGTLQVGNNNALGTGAVTMAPGTTFSFTTTGLTIANNFRLIGDPIFDVATGQTDTLSGAITDSAPPAPLGVLEKTGAGTLILTGTNSYSGGTTISAGTLQIGNGGTIGSITGNVTDNANLAFDRSDTITFGGIVSGSGALAQTGTGTTILTGANAYTGGTFVTAGTLRLGVAGAVPAGGLLNVGAGATFDLNNFNQTIGDLLGAGSITLGSGTLTEGTANATLFSGVISGSGGLVKQGTGMLVLGGANTFTGGTLINAGILQLGTGGSLVSTGSVAIAANALFDVNGHNQTIGDLSGAGVVALGAGTLTEGTANSTAFSGRITGTGGLSKQGTGTLTLSGFNSFTGPTAINAGTLALSGGDALSDTTSVTVGGAGTLSLLNNERIGSLAGSGAVTIIGNVLFTGGNNGSTSFSGVISGAGSLAKEGSGTFTLTGADSFTGGLGVFGGTLALGAGGSVASAAFVDLFNSGAAFDISAGGTQTIQDLFGVAGANVVLGANRLTEGTANSTQFDGVISGSGGLTKVGTGTLRLTGANSFTGATLINAGALSLAGGAALSDQSDVTIASGALLNLESSETIGGLTGTGGVQLNANTLTFDADNVASTFAGQVGGSGGFTKIGTGLFTFAGTNFSTGLTSALGGEFRLTGAIAHDMVVKTAGTLSGNGMIAGNLSLQSGGTVSPGLVTGTFGNLAVGSFTASGGTLAIDFGGASTGNNSDHLISIGAANLTGGLVDARPLTASSDFTFDQLYMIVAAPQVTGTFANPAAFTANSHDSTLLQRLRYDRGGVVLEIRRLIDFTSGLGIPNQIAVGKAFNSTELLADDNFAGLLNSLNLLSTADRGSDFASMSGEGAADAAWFGIEGLDRFTKVLQEHLGTGAAGDNASGYAALGGLGARSGAAAGLQSLWTINPALMLAGANSASSAPQDSRGKKHGVWLEGFSLDDRVNGDSSGTASTRFSGDGAAAGFDLALGRHASFGLAGGYSEPRSETRDLMTRASGKAIYVGGYLRYDNARWFGGLTADYGSTDVRLSRGVAFGIANLNTTAKTRATSYGVSGVIGYRADLGGAGELQPMATIDFAHNRQNGYTESGAGPFSLQVGSSRADRVTGTLGARWVKPLDMGSMTLTPELRGALAAAGGDRAITLDSVFTGAPAGTGSFQATGTRLPQSWAIVGAGLTLGSKTSGFSLHAGYEGAFGGRLRASHFDLGIQLRW